MAEKVKIYEIAKRVGIPSGELVKICRRAGYDQITHHSNAVEPAEAEKIRKAAIRLYRPPAPKKKPVEKKPTPAEKPATGAEKKAEPKARATAKAPAAAEEKEPQPDAEEAAATKGKSPRAKATARAREVWAEARRVAQQREFEQLDAEEAPGVEQKSPGLPPAGPKPARPRKGDKARERKEEKAEKPQSRTRTVIFKQRRKPVAKQRPTSIELEPPITVRDLSEGLGVGANEIIRRLLTEHTVMANINQSLEPEVVELIGLDYGVEISFKGPKSANELLEELIPEDEPGDLEPRPPIVALLGHVDHGKTSILDRIRNTEVAASEDGGITQDIGAWQMTREGHQLTFVDTPGHEAFTAMRAHGAQVTDIVVLVVAADDGVMPQTEEAISHARAAGVPIVVALNKIDKSDANSMRVMQQLASDGLNPEEWGGDVGCVQVSALTGQGIDELIERIILEAEIHDLRANPGARATGTVMEARMVQGLGVVANVVVRSGTLRTGDLIVAGPAWGRVRSLNNEHGQQIVEAPPATPVAVSGLDRLPETGDKFVVVEDQDLARSIAGRLDTQQREQRRQRRAHVTLENLYESLAAGREKLLRVVVKADVKGSLEPIINSFMRLGTDEVNVRVLHQGVGSVNTSDVLLADASDAVIVAFRVGIEDRAESLARECGVEIRYYRVIYESIRDVRQALEGLLTPDVVEEKVGEAEVRQTFKISRLGTIAGCYVRNGQLRRGAKARLVREGVVVHESTIGTLRREKDDAREVEAGYECGVKLEGYNDIQIGDSIQCYRVSEVKRVLS